MRPHQTGKNRFRKIIENMSFIISIKLISFQHFKRGVTYNKIRQREFKFLNFIQSYGFVSLSTFLKKNKNKKKEEN